METDTITANRRLTPQLTSRPTNGASRKVNRIARASGMNTSSATRNTAMTMTTVRRTARVADAWPGPFMGREEAGIVPPAPVLSREYEPDQPAGGAPGHMGF